VFFGKEGWAVFKGKGFKRIGAALVAGAVMAATGAASAEPSKTYYFACTAHGPYGSNYHFISPIFTGKWGDGSKHRAAWRSVVSNSDEANGRTIDYSTCLQFDDRQGAQDMVNEERRSVRRSNFTLQEVSFNGG